LGHVSFHEEVRACLVARLTGGDPRDAIAAACAMAFTRNTDYIPDLDAAIAESEGEGHQGNLQAALNVLEGKNLRSIQSLVKRIGEDEIERERIFFR